MLGQDVAYDRVPYFYTDQYDLGMEYRLRRTRRL
jgi:3-phenylpropionate/trans-cinnamate dioxygenase ferredoxin reductase subunit